MEKFKEWIKDHKALAGGLLGLVLALFYWLYKKFSGSNAGSSATTAADSSGGYYQPATAAGSAGGGSGDGGQAALSNLTEYMKESQAASAEQQKTFLSGITDAMSNFMGGINTTIGNFTSGIKDTITSQNKVFGDALAAQAGNENNILTSIKDLVSSIKTSTAVMPNVPAPVNTPSQPPYAGTVMQGQTGQASGGTVYSNPTKKDTPTTVTTVKTSPTETAINKSVASSGWVDRYIGGSKYTVPAGTRTDWKPGEAFVK